ncbi:hypothetical protein CR970_04370 [Candidatus Saccharibacteria bacterium]|nr:MAG: hypothetical protein CR970_04370 [Candidatus Saccharibacteria bacterium]
MKRFMISIALGVAMVLGLGTAAASAHDFRTGENVNVAKDQVIDGSLFASGSSVDIAGDVNGDVFCAGQTVAVSATVDGDVLCAAQSITITGDVHGDVRLAAQQVTIDGVVTGNATIGAQSVSLTSSGAIDGDISVGSADATINGQVGRDILAGTGTLDVNGTVGRNITTEATQLNLGNNTNIKGKIKLTSYNDAKQQDGAQIVGGIERTDPQNKERSLGNAIGFFIFLLISMAAVALTIALVAPRPLHTTASRALQRPVRTLLIGFGVSVAAPIIIFVIAITMVGIPLAIILGIAWLLVALLSGPMAAYMVGSLLLRSSLRPVVIVAAGSAVVLVIYFIPLVNFLAMLTVLWMGSGAIVAEFVRRLPRPQYTLPANARKPL